MEQTFMTIHNLTPEANILFASDSIVDILGYSPEEVQGRSCFEYFHPDEVPFARSVHSRGVLLDKAAVLHYARIQARDGQWVSCECCFTIVHDVLVACTSIYRRGLKSERRAIEAPQIRRIFSCSPRDPRYHMLEHLSPKFKMPPMEREPRAALILNRFTRSLVVMFATNAVSTILGLRPDEIKNVSFYRCIQENCLAEAVRCLESAKANDSIAYLRFWYRDPREPDPMDDEEEEEHDEEEYDDDESEEEEDDEESSIKQEDDSMDAEDSEMDVDLDVGAVSENTCQPTRPGCAPTSPSELRRPQFHRDGTQDRGGGRGSGGPPEPNADAPPVGIELEAVVSCTSDGLVVVLRKARPPIPAPHPPLLPVENGLFAAPWGQEVIQPQVEPELLHTFRPPLMPQYMPLRDCVKAAGGPPIDQLMRSIRDVAVFAWALAGINGTIANYGRGTPRGEAQPPDGLPVWEPHHRGAAAGANAAASSYLGPDNQAALRWAQQGAGGVSAPVSVATAAVAAAAAAAASVSASASSRRPPYGSQYNPAAEPPRTYGGQAWSTAAGAGASYEAYPYSQQAGMWPQSSASYHHLGSLAAQQSSEQQHHGGSQSPEQLPSSNPAEALFLLQQQRQQQQHQQWQQYSPPAHPHHYSVPPQTAAVDGLSREQTWRDSSPVSASCDDPPPTTEAAGSPFCSPHDFRSMWK